MKLPSTNPFATIVNAYNNPIFLKDGGQKQVFKIVHSTFGDAVLKVGIYHSRQGLERISREVLLLRDIDSIYYPKNYDFKIHSNFVFEIIEEFVESTPLSNLLSNYNARNTVLLIRHLVNGLKVIWDKRTVHRDIKPDNILITSNGTPKIIDLGIARQLDLNSLTHTLQARGPCTPFYAAPEQLSNRKTEIRPRTDQFNLGIIISN